MAISKGDGEGTAWGEELRGRCGTGGGGEKEKARSGRGTQKREYLRTAVTERSKKGAEPSHVT